MLLLEMVRKDNPSLSLSDAWSTVARMNLRQGIPSCCIHQMPEGLSAIINGVCVRCNGTVSK